MAIKIRKISPKAIIKEYFELKFKLSPPPKKIRRNVVCIENNIKLIIPTIDTELIKLSENEKTDNPDFTEILNPEATPEIIYCEENRISFKEIPAGPKQIKIVLVGDTAVGKSCLIRNYLENCFSEDYEPTVLDVYKGIKNVKKKQITLEIHDTSGDEFLGVNR